MSMKTVKEIALDLDVSQVTIYNHIKKLDKELKGNIFKKQGVTHLDNEGIRQIKISMGLIQVPQVKEYVSTEQIVNDISKQVTDSITENITDLVTEIITDNLKIDYDLLQEQIKQLQEQNEQLINLIESNQSKTLLERLKGLFKA